MQLILGHSLLLLEFLNQSRWLQLDLILILEHHFDEVQLIRDQLGKVREDHFEKRWVLHNRTFRSCKAPSKVHDVHRIEGKG